MATLPFDDQPPKEWRRPLTEEDAPNVLPPEDPKNPVFIGIMFCNALAEHRKFRRALGNLVTPESKPAWGDFSGAAAMLAAINDYAYASFTNAAYDAPDVQYFKILSNVPESYQVIDDQPVMAAAVLTLVWRPEHERWMVHSIGDSLLPEDVPRSAPGQTPEGFTQ